MQATWSQILDAHRIHVRSWNLGIGLILFFYVAYRAMTLSLTHDEAGTTDLLALTYQDIIGSSKAFTSANNHILNSWLMKLSVAWFGDVEWALRLPNVLAFPVYFWASRKLISFLSSDTVIQFLILIIFCAHPYVIDFFSLCRGYGLALAFQSLTLFYTLEFLRQKNILCILWASLMLSGCVLANLTWLNFLIAWWIAMGMYLFLKEGLTGISGNAKYFILPIGIHGVLGLLLWNPLQWIRSAGELRWGSNGWFDAQHSFSKDYLYIDIPWPAMLLQGVMLVIFVWTLRHIYLQYKSLYRNVVFNPTGFLFLLLISCIGLSVMLRNLIDTWYPNGRKALMYFMLWDALWINLILLFGSIRVKQKRLAFAAAVLLLGGILLIRTNSVREWRYDNQTKFVFQWLSTFDTSSSNHLAVHWKFKPAMDYYLRRSGLQNWIIYRIDQPDTLHEPDYLYTILEKDQKSLPYPVVLELGDQRILYRIKQNLP